MSPVGFLLLVVAGFFTGLVGFVTGMASIVSYPALLAAGLSPVTANVTNTVAMVAVGVGSTANSGRELVGRGTTLVRWAIYAALGGLTGALVLLVAPEGSFESVVPFLVAFASIALLVQPVVRRHIGEAVFPRLVAIAVFVIAIYGGYFGAGAGVIYLSLMLIFTTETMWSATILKSFLLGIANLVAALGFAIFGPVHWVAAAALSLGALAGGWCGPPVVKVIPPEVLRIAVGLCGLGLAGYLLF
ncbi:sulfite exporter TauE/SafE family protein [Antrihabitans sp. YC2-6]|uniref:sulfite exporter TauE/SafE family protein n=1 Tax=Antrihabitans sp. YC2-6 TaxID=2799498 RepID=UPI0018F324B6|nr:sulfite exporter TauE/SafE family protein [Antrihabitans sp. YC2-6]MBJ8343694.1 sulfite exporter TauE/SafE family protein [Antrihabitans sp. YC2-6]